MLARFFMKPASLATIAILPLLASCMSKEVFVHPDQSVTISWREGGLLPSAKDLWIKGAVPGKITPASNLKVHVRFRGIKPFDEYKRCAGYVDWTRADRIAVRLASEASRGRYYILEEGVHRLPKPSKP